MPVKRKDIEQAFEYWSSGLGGFAVHTIIQKLPKHTHSRWLASIVDKVMEYYDKETQFVKQSAIYNIFQEQMSHSEIRITIEAIPWKEQEESNVIHNLICDLFYNCMKILHNIKAVKFGEAKALFDRNADVVFGTRLVQLLKLHPERTEFTETLWDIMLRTAIELHKAKEQNSAEQIAGADSL